MRQHIFSGVTAPTTAPEGIGHHYIDTVAKKAYFSVGTSSSSDWIFPDGDWSFLVEDVIVNGVTNRAPSQNAVYDALANLTTLINTWAGEQQSKLVSSDLTILSGKTLIRGETELDSSVTLEIELNGTLIII